ncbi:MAG TPA: hypothetical protein VFR67_07095 [Pilimelia sp.]|nr:hypothetical protein [Pilimelia sp.]
MSEIVRGVLGGGWGLLVGWIVPSLLNVIVLISLLPRLARHLPPAGTGLADTLGLALPAVLAAVVLGLLLAALQTPLYRLLEGYLGWPSWLFTRARARQLRRKALLTDRITLQRLAAEERAGHLPPGAADVLAALRAHPVVAPYEARDGGPGTVRSALLNERLRRFPVADDQVVATALGNAIRRLEEYGYDRYRLDSQVLWYELTGVTSEHSRDQVDRARATVDFFVALLYGHLAVAVVLAAARLTGFADGAAPAYAAAVLVAAAPVWYRVAVTVTDEWAAAVRAMVNTGRQPLAEALALRLPATLAEERQMWALTGKLARLPYDAAGAAELDRYRVNPEPDPGRGRGPEPDPESGTARSAWSSDPAR